MRANNRRWTTASSTREPNEVAARPSALPRELNTSSVDCRHGSASKMTHAGITFDLGVQLIVPKHRDAFLTPLCNRRSEACPPQWDRNEAAQRRCSDSEEQAPSRPHPQTGCIRLAVTWEPSNQRFRWSCSVLVGLPGLEPGTSFLSGMFAGYVQAAQRELPS
jgi:hypothetical protein